MSTRRPVLLVVDDEPGILHLLHDFGDRAGFEVVTCSGGAPALEYLHAHTANIAIVDLQMPEIGGLDVLRAIREADAQCQTVLMTGHATVDSAIEAIQSGAMDYLSKPIDFGRLGQLLAAVQSESDRQRAVAAADQEAARHLVCGGMIGRDPAMQELFRLIRRLSPHARTALITGETGTGKELVAAALHDHGPRRARRLVTINCAAVVETLFESELFGHMRGAFTGATENKPGLFESADGGTIFLDEVGELPLNVQAKLLRVLEHGEVQRVGALQAKRVDVNVIAATNRDLLKEAEAGRFRSDLYYRLNVVQLHVPPLRERRDDIPYLVAAFVRECGARMGKPLTGVTAGAERTLVTASWPGNVRELRNAIERAAMLAEGDLITERDVMAAARIGRPAEDIPRAPRRPAAGESDRLDLVERDHIVNILERTKGNKSEAARMLGVSRRAFYRKLERHGLSGPRPGADNTK
jgi:two-component system response regulator HydG